MARNQTTEKTIARALKESAALSIARTLRRAFPKSQTYLVGGYLRDAILGRASKDIDLVVSGVPARTLERFLKQHGRVNLVGRTFGVFKFIPKASKLPAIDVALPRRDFSAGTGGYRDVTVQSDWRLPIERDLARRDFTVNAMAWDVLGRTLVDPTGGQADLETRRIRAVGKPETRFREDYSRVLRALRFACQLDFTIEPKTLTAIRSTIGRINSVRKGERVVPYETVAKELLKAFHANPPRAFDLWDQAGAIRALIPELLPMKRCPQPPAYHSEGDVWMHTRLALSVLTEQKFIREFGTRANAEVIFAVLFHDIGKPETRTMPKKRGERIRFDGHDRVGAALTKKIAERLRLSSYKDAGIDVDTERLASLVARHLLLISGSITAMRATTIERHYLRDQRLGEELLMLQFADGSATRPRGGTPTLREYRAMKRRIARMLHGRKPTLPPPILDGNEIMRLLRIKPGPEVGAALEKLREAQLRGRITTKAEARTFVLRLKV